MEKSSTNWGSIVRVNSGENISKKQNKSLQGQGYHTPLGNIFDGQIGLGQAREDGPEEQNKSLQGSESVDNVRSIKSLQGSEPVGNVRSKTKVFKRTGRWTRAWRHVRNQNGM